MGGEEEEEEEEKKKKKKSSGVGCAPNRVRAGTGARKIWAAERVWRYSAFPRSTHWVFWLLFFHGGSLGRE